MIVAFVAVLGVSVALYPQAASWFSDLRHAQAIEAYNARIDDAPARALARDAVAAREYNGALPIDALALAANGGLEIATEEGQHYADLLDAGGGLMAQLTIPRIGLSLPVSHGTDDLTLKNGIGHLEGSALPVGGTSTHAVLTGHRGLASSELFTHLGDIEIDDTFALDVLGEVLTYNVVSIRVVAPGETESLAPQMGRDLVTLVTCTPLGINSHRLLVMGERSSVIDASDDLSENPVPGLAFPWWVLLLSAAVCAAIAYVWVATRCASRDQGFRSRRER